MQSITTSGSDSPGRTKQSAVLSHTSTHATRRRFPRSRTRPRLSCLCRWCGCMFHSSIVAMVFACSQNPPRDHSAEHLHSNSPPFGHIVVAAHAVCQQRGSLLHDLRHPLPNGELDVCIILLRRRTAASVFECNPFGVCVVFKHTRHPEL